MFESQEYGLPRGSKATLVSIVSDRMPGHQNLKETKNSLIELKELLRTLEIESTSEHIQNKKEIEAASVLGSGRLKEIAELAKDEESDFLVFDFELTASQVRNIKKLTGLEVIDRCNVILEIFAQHARTKEAKIQIEISRLQYLLPRLTSFWTHFGKQKGGIGLKGEGEQQLELDRRIVRQKIEFYKKQLRNVQTSREQQKKKRQNQAVTAALVGYTNAGKSSLMNRLCRVDILEEDKLFATLDSTFRVLNPDTKPPMILIDTVGFISNLPNTLIEGFKTTLESALEADLLIMVIDLSDDNFENHINVTNEVLKELGIVDKPIIYVFNKKDQVENLLQKKILLAKYDNRFVVSSFDENDINQLRKEIIGHFLKQQKELDLFVPYEDGQAHSQIVSKTNVVKTQHHEKGIYYKVKSPDFILANINIGQYMLSESELAKYGSS